MSKKQLKHYETLRDFSTTSEPRGRVSTKNNPPIFVIHKHDARSLHYDLRLEDAGVLKSWAIPKGPSDNPHDKRLAIQTEDHPLEYADFEGVIPEGNYGAGGVMIWDRGTFKNLKEASLSDCLKKGLIEIDLKGKKLQGSYALIHTGFSENSWLFIKMKEQMPSYDHLLEENRSIVSGKTMSEIEKDELTAIDHGRHNGIDALDLAKKVTRKGSQKRAKKPLKKKHVS